ncbi:MAG: hypothetical protein V3S31_04445 [Dehalococcoidia bacterium]
MLRSLRRGPVLAVLAAVAIFSVGGAAFTAANTVPTSSAGEGTGVISGYTITAIAYTLNATDRSFIDTVAFTATADNASAGTTLSNIFVEVDDGTNEWYTCTRGGGVAPAHDITCDTTPTNATSNVQLTVLDADSLTAVITEE